MKYFLFNKRAIKLLAIITLLISYSMQDATFVGAQELTAPSDEVSTASALPRGTAGNVLNGSEQDTPIMTPTPSFAPPIIQPSAQIKTPPIIRNLLKRTYRTTEPITVEVDNTQSQRVEATVLDTQGNSVDFDVFTIDNGNSKTVVVKPPRVLRPGKYFIQVTSGDSTYTQDFTWGVLAINTDKSIYLPNETANIAMGVLDERGDMICNANVVLIITSPDGVQKQITTQDGQIKVNQQCYKHDVVPTPDYETTYTVDMAGDYSMVMTASTIKGTYTVSDSFKVMDSVPFDVKRQTATRIYPPNSYPVDFTITANQDFKGKVVESVPASFAVSTDDAGSQPFQNIQKVSQTSVDQVLGASTSAYLALPYKGTYPISEEFGEKLADGPEKNLYALFNLAGHDGVDFDMPIGTPIYASDDGTVVLAGDGAYGTTLVIEHSWGRTYYGHLSKLDVSVGDSVKKGEQVALSGNTGLTTGPHLHFGVKPNNPDMQNGYYGKIDPLPLLGIESTKNDASQVKLLTWEISAKKGDSFKLSYYYRAPNISPEFYKLGPLKFYEDGVNEFQEARQWQIAVDAGTVTVITTSYTDPCGSNCYTIPSDWDPSNNTIEVVGPGGNGVTSTTLPGGGGGGGGYAKASNQIFTPGSSVSFQIGTGGSGSSTWFSTSGFLAASAGGNATGRTHGNGGSGSGTATPLSTNSGGNGGDGGNLAGAGGGGGGGAGGPNGAGGTGGSGIATANTGGGGGGGNGSGQASKNGSAGTNPNGGNGGVGNGGTGGGTGGAGIGGNGTAGTGGGGAGGAGKSGAAFGGGSGAASTDMGGGTTGTGGGGGGGGGSNRTAGNGNNAGAGGTTTADTGAGGGGGGDCTDSGCAEGTGQSGSNGFIVVTYTPLVTGPTLDQVMRHGQWFNNGVAQPFTF